MESVKVYGKDVLGGRILNQWGTFKRNKTEVDKKIKYNNKTYEAVDYMKEYYNKAIIYQNINDSNDYILLSYTTIVAEYNGEYFTIHGYFSQTTGKHINAFLEKFGFGTLSKKEIENTKILYYNK